MRVRDKEHQSLGIKELQELCHDFPNDQQLGEEVRKIAHATVNNSKSQRVTSENYEDNPSDIERDYEDYPKELKKSEIDAFEERIHPISKEDSERGSW